MQNWQISLLDESRVNNFGVTKEQDIQFFRQEERIIIKIAIMFHLISNNTSQEKWTNNRNIPSLVLGFSHKQKFNGVWLYWWRAFQVCQKHQPHIGWQMMIGVKEEPKKGGVIDYSLYSLSSSTSTSSCTSTININ